MKKGLKYQIVYPDHSSVNLQKHTALWLAQEWFDQKNQASKYFGEGELSLKITSFDDTNFCFVVFDADGNEVGRASVNPMVDQEPKTWMSEW